jgi:hypothetical protein
LEPPLRAIVSALRSHNSEPTHVPDRVGDFTVQRLRHIFGYPGDRINGVFGALNRVEGKINFEQARHEEMALDDRPLGRAAGPPVLAIVRTAGAQRGWWTIPVSMRCQRLCRAGLVTGTGSSSDRSRRPHSARAAYCDGDCASQRSAAGGIRRPASRPRDAAFQHRICRAEDRAARIGSTTLTAVIV